MNPCASSRSHRRSGCAILARQGFTLLEVLVAFAILTVMLVTLYQAFSSNLLILSSTRGLWKAMAYTHNELQRWERMTVPPPLHVDQGAFLEDDPMFGYSWHREVSDQTPLPGVTVRKVSLRLSWSEGKRSQFFESEVYVPRP